jgi:hypothetical protein
LWIAFKETILSRRRAVSEYFGFGGDRDLFLSIVDELIGSG